MTNRNDLSRDDLSLIAAFLIALTATLGALFIGEVLGQMPCTLCWYQRIAMFPLVPGLGLALWRGDGMGRVYGLPLALAGVGLATWHSALYAGILPAPVVPCTQDGPSCTGDTQMIFGLPIPARFLSELLPSGSPPSAALRSSSTVVARPNWRLRLPPHLPWILLS